jgi:hypothetical protein
MISVSLGIFVNNAGSYLSYWLGMLEMTVGFQPKLGNCLTNLSGRYAPAFPSGGKWYAIMTTFFMNDEDPFSGDPGRHSL